MSDNNKIINSPENIFGNKSALSANLADLGENNLHDDDSEDFEDIEELMKSMQPENEDANNSKYTNEERNQELPSTPVKQLPNTQDEEFEGFGKDFTIEGEIVEEEAVIYMKKKMDAKGYVNVGQPEEEKEDQKVNYTEIPSSSPEKDAKKEAQELVKSSLQENRGNGDQFHTPLNLSSLKNNRGNGAEHFTPLNANKGKGSR